MRSREPSSWMWADALELLQSTERLQRRVFVVGSLQAPPCWEPPVDLYELGDELRLLVALPGVNSREFEVILDEAAIVVRGERPMPMGFQRAAIHRLEIPYGRFERRIALPQGDFQLLDQFLEDGCLTLVLRRL
ncbi:MAG TPA: Hsp20/alpha crystallin family protein [Rhodocyclaceae bacterium]|nr:Hsp20/alpha crystallin family protein [Rhodocyclaceae bacterium]